MIKGQVTVITHNWDQLDSPVTAMIPIPVTQVVLRYILPKGKTREVPPERLDL